MAVSIGKSIANVFSDKDFLPKYTVLVVLSFCVGLLTFVSIAENYVWLPVAIPLYLIAVVISCGYDIKYIKELINNENSKMPSWSSKNIKEFLIIGVKYFLAAIIFIFIITPILSLPIFIFSSYIKIHSYLILLALVFLFFALVTIAYLLIFFPAIIYTFINTDYDVLAFFNIKKNCSYFSVNYFTALLAIMCLNLPVTYMAHTTTLRLRYALLYIIPLMIVPIFRMFNCNLMAEAYTSKINNEKGSIAKMFGLLVLAIFEILPIILTVAFIIYSIN